MKNAIWLGTLITLLALPLPALAGQLQATLYKNPHCSCCEAYADYLRENGFDVDVKTTDTLEEITLKAGVPEQLEGCHTMFVDGYDLAVKERRFSAKLRDASRDGWILSGCVLQVSRQQGHA